MSKLQLHIQDRKGKNLASVSLSAEATTDDLKALFAKECQHDTNKQRRDPERTRTAVGSTRLSLRCVHLLSQTQSGM